MFNRRCGLAVVATVFVTAGFAWCGNAMRSEVNTADEVGLVDSQPDDVLPYWRSIRQGDMGAYIDRIGQIVLTTELNVIQSRGAMQLFDFGAEAVARIRHGQRRWGLIDRSGKIIVAPKYEGMGLPAFGVVPVQLHGRWGLLDYQGHEVLPTRYLQIETFSDGLGVVRATLAQAAGEWPDADAEARASELLVKLLDPNPANRNAAMQALLKIGEPLFETRAFIAAAHSAQDGNTQLANVIDRVTSSAQRSAKWGYINPKGEFVIEPRFGLASSLQDGRAWVVDDGVRGYIDRRGELAFHGRGDRFSSGLARLIADDRALFVNDQGQTVIEPAEGQLFIMPGFSEGLAPFKQAGKYGFIDSTGKVVIEAEYEFPSHFSDGLTMVRRGRGEEREFAYINHAGDLVIPWRKGRWYYPFEGGLALFRDNENVYKFMNKQGQVVYDSGVEQLWRGVESR